MTTESQDRADFADYPHIRGVLAYLDITTTAAERATAREIDQGAGINRAFTADSFRQGGLRRSLATTLGWALKLRYTYANPSPIGKELLQFRLFYPPHAADALAAAWCAQQRGASALAALQADYDFEHGGILRREDWPNREIPADAGAWDRTMWETMRAFAENDDQLFHYRYAAGYGYKLLRGRRVVHSHETLHFQPTGEHCEKYVVEQEAYNLAGGSLAVVEGRLSWPPPGWANPLSDEEAKARAKAKGYISKEVREVT